MKKQEIQTETCGVVTVFLQGNFSHSPTKPTFLTVHNIGCNYTSFVNFVDHPSMEEVKKKSLFIHVNVPGQEENAPDLPEHYKFPTLQQLAVELVTVLDTLHVNCVLGLGEGAGANILLRFALAYPGRVMGLVLLDCTSTVAGWIETFKDKFMNWKLSSVGMNHTAESYLLFHRFGYIGDQPSPAKEKMIKEFLENLNKSVNPRNLRRYVEAFLNRTDVTSHLQNDFEVDTLLVTGSNSSNQHEVLAMYQHLSKQRSQLLQIEGVGDVLEEAPEKLARSLVLFAQGQGLLTSADPNFLEHHRNSPGSLSPDPGKDRPGKPQKLMSMEEYDRPNIRKFSVAGRHRQHSGEALPEEAG